LHLFGRENLDPEVIYRARVAGILEEHEFERWFGDREVGVAGTNLGGFGLEKLGVELHGLVEV
jgi:hypothetical protein